MNADIRIKALIGIAVSIIAGIICLICPGNWFALYLLLILPVFYLGLVSIIRINKERKLFMGIESKMRYSDDVIRKKFGNPANLFQRCMVTLPKEGNIKDKVILILPQKPFALYQVDYNGNCINGSGRYDAIGWLHNFAPYNELADGLARYGYLVIRMDMLGACGKEDFTNYEDGVLEWVTYVTELFHVKNDLVVIGHRENNIQAVKLMLKERWKVGILLCCEPHVGHDEEGKSCLDYMLELGKEHSVLQINACIGGKRKNKIRETDKLKCKYKSVNAENMDISLRKGKSRNLSEKGYGILCGTGNFPPVYEGLAEEIAAYILGSQSMETKENKEG